MHKKIYILLSIFFISFSGINAQLTKLSGSNIYSEYEVYKDSKGSWYSTSVTIKFAMRTIDLPRGEKNATFSDIIVPTTKGIFEKIEKKYGKFRLEKVFINASWGDTIGTNIVTKKKVKLKDESQFYKIVFEKIICVDSLITELKELPNIASAEGPFVAVLTYTPNDYSATEQWALPKMEATKAWDITHGSTDIKIGISDVPLSYDANNIHNELKNGKVVYNPGNYAWGHLQVVAGCAAALTDNGTGISSIGFDTRMMFAPPSSYGISLLRTNGADIINCSWMVTGYLELSTEIYNCLQSGIIVTAGSGNNQDNIDDAGLGTIPVVPYPAAYNFPDIGKQVIAVTATHKLENGSEVFGYPPDGRWNYSPGTDPIGNPTTSFVDFSAPGVFIKCLDTTINNAYMTASGSSLSAPEVAGIIALIKSIYPALSPEIAYMILKNTSDKVGTDSYDVNGWNQYMGYGRVNAYKALKYTIEHYGGTFNQDVIIPAGDTWNIQAGVTLSFNSGCAFVVNGTLNAQGSSSNKITFTRNGSSGTWGGIRFNSGSSGTLSNCTINNAVYGIYADNGSDVYIKSCELLNNTYGIYGYYYCDLKVTGNYIHNNTYGVQGAYGSTAKLYGNVIENNSSYGVIGYYGAIFQLGLPYTWSGYNTIRENGNYEIYSYNSNTDIDICNASVHDDSGNEIVNSGTTSIYCLNSWFGSNGLSSSGTIVNVGQLGSEPAWEGELDDDDSSLPKMNNNPDIPNKYRGLEGVLALKNIIKDNSRSTEEISHALADLYSMLRVDYRKNNYSEREKFYDFLTEHTLNKKEKTLITQASKYQISWKILGKDYQNAIILSDKLLKDCSAEDSLEVLLSKAKLNFIIGEKDKAKMLVSDIRSKYGNNNQFVLELADILENTNNNLEEGNQFRNEEISTDQKNVTSKNEFSIDGNYPNPFNPTTTISYSLPEAGNVQIKVYDVLGCEVAKLVDETKSVGKHTVEWNGSNSASGIYFYVIIFNNQTLYKKMLMVK